MMAETQQISGGSLVAIGIIILILFLLFPYLTIWLIWLAIFVLIVGGAITILLKPST